MPELRYVTLDGEPPNGGVPPGTLFAQARNPPNGSGSPNTPADNGPPNGGAPPDAGALVLAPDTNTYRPAPVYSVWPVIPAVVAQSFSSPQSSSSALRPCRVSSEPDYEPPGQFVDGQVLRGQGWSYISPGDQTTIFFVGNGVRPCDAPNGYYPHQFRYSMHKVSSQITVRMLIEGLGCPPGQHYYGITELIPLGNYRFAAGDTFTQGGEASRRTLAEVGWGANRGYGNEVRLVVKR